MCKAFYLEIGFWKSKLCLIVPQGPEALADMPDMARLHREAPASASDSQAAASVGEQAGAVPPPPPQGPGQEVVWPGARRPWEVQRFPGQNYGGG